MIRLSEYWLSRACCLVQFLSKEFGEKLDSCDAVTFVVARVGSDAENVCVGWVGWCVCVRDAMFAGGGL